MINHYICAANRISVSEHQQKQTHTDFQQLKQESVLMQHHCLLWLQIYTAEVFESFKTRSKYICYCTWMETENVKT